MQIFQYVCFVWDVSFLLFPRCLHDSETKFVKFADVYYVEGVHIIHLNLANSLNSNL